MKFAVKALVNTVATGQALIAGNQYLISEEDAAFLVPRGMVRLINNGPRFEPLSLWRGRTLAQPQKRGLLGKPSYLTFGDSIMALGNNYVAPASITRSGNIATLSLTAHGIWPGARFTISGCDQREYNGEFYALAVPDANSLQFEVTGSPASPATGATIRVMTQDKITDRHFMEYANAALGQRLWYIRNAAIGGERTDQALIRIGTDVLAYDPDIVVECTGTNDLLQDVPVDTAFRNRVEIWETMLDAGITPLVLTLCPLGDSYAGYTAARYQTFLRFNRLVRSYVERRRFILMLDAYSLMVDPASAVGAYRSGYTTDFIHPGKQGYQVLGEAARALLAPLVMAWPSGISSLPDTYATDSTNPQLNDNPLMSGSTTATAPASGNTPTGYQLQSQGGGSQTVAGTVGVVRADGVGSNHRIVVTSAASNDRFDLRRAAQFSGRLSAGDLVVMEVNIKGSALTNFSYLYASLDFTIDGLSYSCNAMSSGGTDGWAADFDLWLRTPPLRIPAGALTSFNARIIGAFRGVGGGTFEVGRWQVAKVSD